MQENCVLVIIGDEGCGKTSLIQKSISQRFPESVELISDEVCLPSNEPLYPCKGVVLIDTSAEPEYRDHLKLKLLEADLTMIVYDTTDDHTWKNVEQLWLPLVLEVYQGDLSRGIMIVGTKIDLLSPEEREVVMNRRCSDPKVHSLICQYLFSSKNGNEVEEIFSLAEAFVIYPTAPLYDVESATLTTAAHEAFHRIFQLYDTDCQGELNYSQFNLFCKSCLTDELGPEEFHALLSQLQQFLNSSSDPLPSAELSTSKRMSEELFLAFLSSYIKKYDPPYRFLWRILRSHSYDTTLVCPCVQMRNFDGVQELSDSAIRFLQALPSTSFASFPVFSFSLVAETDREDEEEDDETSEDHHQRIFHTLMASNCNDRDWLSFWVGLVRIDPSVTLNLLFRLGYSERVAGRGDAIIPRSNTSQSIHICLIGSEPLSSDPLCCQYRAISEIFPDIVIQFPESSSTPEVLSVTVSSSQASTVILTAISLSHLSSWLDVSEASMKVDKWYIVMDPQSFQSDDLCLAHLSAIRSQLLQQKILECSILCLSSQNSNLNLCLLRDASHQMKMSWIESPSSLITAKSLQLTTTVISKPMSSLNALHSPILQRILLLGGVLGLAFAYQRWDGKWSQYLLGRLSRWISRFRRDR